MTRPAARRPARDRMDTQVTLQVRRSQWLTPHLVRVTLAGPELPLLVDNGFADRCVKLVFPRASPADGPARPLVRTYTIRTLDLDVGELAIDVVVHGTEGVAGPWAATAGPGDEITLLGPGGSYAPRDDVDAHVLIGDESVLPAIALTCERIAPGVPVHVVAEVGSSADHLPLHSLGDLTVHWVHRDEGDDVVRAVERTPWPVGRVQAFLHGEASAVRALRAHLLGPCAVPRDLLSVSGYWRRGAAGEQFQAEKRAELRRTGTAADTTAP